MSRVERRLRKRRRRRSLVLVVLFLLVVSGAVYEVVQLTGHRGPRITPGRPVTVTVRAGEDSVEIGRSLQDAGVVDSLGRFRAAAAERGLDAALKPGTYHLTTGMDIDAVLDILSRGPDAGLPLTIPEGFTVRQIVDRIAATGRFSKAEVDKALASRDLVTPYRPKSVTSLEGLLFPETYAIRPDDTPVDVLQHMLDQLQRVLSEQEGLASPPLRLTAYQVLIVASMVEREAKVAADRPKVAAVIYNRLRAKKLLQIDATVEYALGATNRRLSTADLKVSSPFNTYRHAGLPPTPIASPGEASIRAALQPADGNWLYYVLISKTGAHAFTASYDEFAQLKAKARAKGLL